MLSLERCREILMENSIDIDDATLLALRAQLYAIVTSVLDEMSESEGTGLKQALGPVVDDA